MHLGVTKNVKCTCSELYLSVWQKCQHQIGCDGLYGDKWLKLTTKLVVMVCSNPETDIQTLHKFVIIRDHNATADVSFTFRQLNG
jgi:hypothetical protein